MEELYDLIEQYLDGALPDAEREEVERRIATDTDFRNEVELHRAMHTSLGDADNFRLRIALDTLLRDPPLTSDIPLPKTAPTFITSSFWLRLTVIAALLAVIGFSVWLWLPTDGETTRPLSSPPGQSQPIDTASVIPPDTASLPVKPNPSKPIAMADPADFVPNPILEARIGDMMRGNGIRLELTSPTSGVSFQLQNGRIMLPVRGSVTGGDIPADQPLKLFVYSNRPEAWENKQSLFQFPLTLQSTTEGAYMFSSQLSLRLRPGLYYIVVGQLRLNEEDESYAARWIGKIFVVDKR